MEYIKLNNNYNYIDSIKIQLRINNNITDISYMFYECGKLLLINDLSADNINITDKNKSFDWNNSNNYREEYDNSDETDKTENFYNDNLTLSTIQKNTIISDLTGNNDLNYFKENIFEILLIWVTCLMNVHH